MAVINPSDETNEEVGHFGLHTEYHKMMQPNTVNSSDGIYKQNELELRS